MDPKKGDVNLAQKAVDKTNGPTLCKVNPSKNMGGPMEEKSKFLDQNQFGALQDLECTVSLSSIPSHQAKHSLNPSHPCSPSPVHATPLLITDEHSNKPKYLNITPPLSFPLKKTSPLSLQTLSSKLIKNFSQKKPQSKYDNAQRPGVPRPIQMFLPTSTRFPPSSLLEQHVMIVISLEPVVFNMSIQPLKLELTSWDTEYYISYSLEEPNKFHMEITFKEVKELIANPFISTQKEPITS